MKTALITGVAGQDGSYLAELLISKGYRVGGIVRRNSTPEHQGSRIDHLTDIETIYGDVTDDSSIRRALDHFQPDEVYNLAAQSHVRVSFEVPQFTASTNGLGVLSFLDTLRSMDSGNSVRFYQASSSEMFGDSVDPDGFQRETTPMNPVSPYGCAKLFAYSVVRNYRKSYSMFASNGILFNHESPRRGSNFVTSKVVKAAVEIKLGLKTGLEMGNLDSFRDWGHSRDYVRAMHLILSQDQAEDFVIATGETRSVRDLLDVVFTYLNLNYRDHVTQNPKFLRPQELPYLKGDAGKARSALSWKPEISFEEMIHEMVDSWMDRLKH